MHSFLNPLLFKHLDAVTKPSRGLQPAQPRTQEMVLLDVLLGCFRSRRSGHRPDILH